MNESREIVAALRAWLDEPRALFGTDGRPMIWMDGRPVALDVALAKMALEWLGEAVT